MPVWIDMLPYLLLLAFSLCIIICFRWLRLPDDLRASALICLAIFFFAAARGDVGTDNFSYRLFFEKFNISSVESFEVGFVLITGLLRLITDNSQIYIAYISAIQCILVFFIAKNIERKDFFVIFYLVSYYVDLHLNLLRFGISTLMVIAGLLIWRQKLLASIAVVATAALFHISAIASAPLFVLGHIRGGDQPSTPKGMVLKPYQGVAIASGLAVMSGLVLWTMRDKIITRLGGTCSDGWTPTFGIGFVSELSLAMLAAVSVARPARPQVFAAIGLWAMFRMSGCLIPVSDRLAILFEVIAFVLLIVHVRGWLAIALLGVIGVFHLYETAHFLTHSDAAIDALVLGRPEFAVYGVTRWLPFQFFWE